MKVCIFITSCFNKPIKKYNTNFVPPKKKSTLDPTRYDYNLTIMKSPKPATDTIYPHIKF
jgi:hypothetical protein